MNIERTSHPSAAQVDMLIDFLEKKPSLAKGFSKNQSAKQAANREWDRITLKLNSMGGGTVKTAKKWMKYWSDKKSAVKKKAAARASSRNVTGGGIADLPELSNIEERILHLMGGESFATGDIHLQIQPFDEPSQQNESPSILTPMAQASTTCTNIPEMDNFVIEIPGTCPIDIAQVINTTEVDLSLGHRGQSQFMDTLRDSETEVTTTSPRPNESLGVNITTDMDRNLSPANNRNIAQPEPDGRLTSSEIDRRQTPARSYTQQQPTRPNTRPPSGLLSPRRPRRRILQPPRRNVQASPPSQRRANLIGMAEKFLRLEQQRLDLDSRMLALMERNSERDHLLVEATKAIGEGLKALAEAIKR